MTYAKRSLWLATGGILAMLGAVACSMAGVSSEAARANGNSPDNKGEGTSGGSSSGGFEQPATGANATGPTATGVVLVHAAALPSFRLCFENLPDLFPQPDSKVMPEANVVGVEMGSYVRVDPITPPGTIYVINESEVRSDETNSNAVKCGDLLGPIAGRPKTPKTLTKDIDYFVAPTRYTEPLGQNQVNALVITGCASQVFLTELGIDNKTCPAKWNQVSGNIDAKLVVLKTTPEGATDTKLPIQLFHMSTAIDAYTAGGGTLSVTFGDLANIKTGALPQPVPTGPIFEGGAQKSLDVDQKTDSVYGAFGFRVSVQAGANKEVVDQSLAGVQELSSSRDLPTSYYRVASNYGLFLVGDPAHKATLTGGAPNPNFNPRQAVHILAVPVLDPTKIGADAGADGGGGEAGAAK